VHQRCRALPDETRVLLQGRRWAAARCTVDQADWRDGSPRHELPTTLCPAVLASSKSGLQAGRGRCLPGPGPCQARFPSALQDDSRVQSTAAALVLKQSKRIYVQFFDLGEIHQQLRDSQQRLDQRFDVRPLVPPGTLENGRATPSREIGATRTEASSKISTKMPPRPTSTTGPN